MELFETIAFLGLGMISLHGSVPMQCVCSVAFCERSGSEVNMSHVFPEGCSMA